MVTASAKIVCWLRLSIPTSKIRGGRFIKEETSIANRYSKFGVTEQQVNFIVESGIAHGFTHEMALIGARLALSLQYGIHEYFTPEETALVTGETVEGIQAAVEAGGIDHVTIRPAPGFEALFTN